MVGSLNGPLHQGLDGYYDHNRHWWPNTPLLPDEARVRPETVPLDYLAGHRVGCGCTPCQTYPEPGVLVGAKRRALREAARRRE